MAPTTGAGPGSKKAAPKKGVFKKTVSYLLKDQIFQSPKEPQKKKKKPVAKSLPLKTGGQEGNAFTMDQQLSEGRKFVAHQLFKS